MDGVAFTGTVRHNAFDNRHWILHAGFEQGLNDLYNEETALFIGLSRKRGGTAGAARPSNTIPGTPAPGPPRLLIPPAC